MTIGSTLWRIEFALAIPRGTPRSSAIPARASHFLIFAIGLLLFQVREMVLCNPIVPWEAWMPIGMGHSRPKVPRAAGHTHYCTSGAPVRLPCRGNLLTCGCVPTAGRTLLGLTSTWTVRPSTRDDIASLGIETIAKMDVLASIVSDLGELHLEPAFNVLGQDESNPLGIVLMLVDRRVVEPRPLLRHQHLAVGPSPNRC